jgi:hypothetical protein
MPCTQRRLIFVDPHGLLSEKHPSVNPKVSLHKKLQSAMASSIKKAIDSDLAVQRIQSGNSYSLFGGGIFVSDSRR